MYIKFLLMLTISFCIMYAIMFFNVDRFDHIYSSLNRTYMSLLMVSSMCVVMMLMMGHMYKNKKINSIIILTGISVFILSFLLLRKQLAIGDEQYMKGMIPHHSSAIMTSKHADIKDPEVKELSKHIIESQEKEIAEMKRILERMKK